MSSHVTMHSAISALRRGTHHVAAAITSLRQMTSGPDPLKVAINEQLEAMRAASTFKEEQAITSPTGARIVVDGKNLLLLCSNNYLGLSHHPEVEKAAIDSIRTHGFGLSSVRFICGTQDLHQQLERTITAFHGTGDTILYPSCFDANAGLFEGILTDQDAVLSDELNHASIIDGIRLCKAQRLRYKHLDMTDLEAKLQQASNARIKLIATDGVFSMDGHIAPLKDIVALAQKYGAYTFVDECHATGVLGHTGRGTDEHCGLPPGTLDIINSTLCTGHTDKVLCHLHTHMRPVGKALGGGTGGYTTGRSEVVQLLRQKSRPYLFSNTLAPAVAGASLKVFELLGDASLTQTLAHNTQYFRLKIAAAGFKIKQGAHPIVPIMFGDARLASQMASRLLAKGVYVKGFSYPVVPKHQARIRCQISAAHTEADLDEAVAAFTAAGKELGVL